MSNIFEVKQKLYEVYKKYKQQGFMSDKFIKSLDGFYSAADPNIFVNRIKSYIIKFDEGKGVDVYKDFINECKFVLNLDDNSDINNTDDENDEFLNNSQNQDSSKNETDTDGNDNDDTINHSDNEVLVEKIMSEPKIVESNVNVDKIVKPKVTVVKPDVIQSKMNSVSKSKSRLTNLDLTSKTLKVPISNGLIDLFDKTIGDSSRDFLMGSGRLSDEELMILSENKMNTSIFKAYDFTLTRSDLFTILVLLGLNHLNVNVTDSLVDDLFEGNDLKIGYFNWVMNTNLVELDVQNRVKKLDTKLNKIKSIDERLEIMLSYLLLERANVPKNKNRDVVKQFLDTSSVMNQSMDAIGVLGGIISSKVVSMKDYKRARGD
jgi:hypothetical protein